jgi:hypothetical protein
MYPASAATAIGTIPISANVSGSPAVTPNSRLPRPLYAREPLCRPDPEASQIRGPGDSGRLAGEPFEFLRPGSPEGAPSARQVAWLHNPGLPHRQIHLLPARFFQSSMADVGNDADHHSQHLSAIVGCNRLTQSINPAATSSPIPASSFIASPAPWSPPREPAPPLGPIPGLGCPAILNWLHVCSPPLPDALRLQALPVTPVAPARRRDPAVQANPMDPIPILNAATPSTPIPRMLLFSARRLPHLRR